MAITLRDVTRDNWRHCIRLDPGPEERALIPSNLYALAEAKFTPSLVPLAIYDDALLVGFAMYDAQPERDGSCSIYSLMID